jgi:hypothetical protein
MSEPWDDFEILTAGLSMSDRSDAFFEYANNNKSDRKGWRGIKN